MDNFENIPQPNEEQPALEYIPEGFGGFQSDDTGFEPTPAEEAFPLEQEERMEIPDGFQPLERLSPRPQASEEAVSQEPEELKYTPWEPEEDDESIPQPEPPVSEKPRKKKKSRGIWKKLLAAVLILALVVGSCGVTASIVSQNWRSRAAQMEASFNGKIYQLQQQLDGVSQKADQQLSLGSLPAGELLTPVQVYALNVDAVVMIYSTVVYSSYGQPTSGTSTGSGFIISQDGYILTNYHVIEGATAVSVETGSGTRYDAAVIGSDSTNDIALLKVNGSGLPVAALGSSDKLNVGDQVVAIGNPLGELTSTMTVGYVSGKERRVTTDGTTIDMIQTDAAINSGNSGGPLFNMRGEVVGITTAKYSGQSSSGASIEGIGFAIPMDDVMEIVADLLEYGYVRSGYMGVTVIDFDSSVASVYNLPAGVYVDGVEAGGPAAAAGIQPEDIIIGLGDQTITCYNDLARALREYEPGDTTTVTVYRAGQKLTLSITLAERPQDTSVSGSGQTQGEMPSEGSYEDWYEYFAPFFGDGNSGG